MLGCLSLELTLVDVGLLMLNLRICTLKNFMAVSALKLRLLTCMLRLMNQELILSWKFQQTQLLTTVFLFKLLLLSKLIILAFNINQLRHLALKSVSLRLRILDPIMLGDMPERYVVIKLLVASAAPQGVLWMHLSFMLQQFLMTEKLLVADYLRKVFRIEADDTGANMLTISDHRQGLGERFRLGGLLTLFLVVKMGLLMEVFELVGLKFEPTLLALKMELFLLVLMLLKMLI